LTKASLVQKGEELQQCEVELQKVTNTFEEEVVVCRAHRDTEVTLNDIAMGLKGVTAQSLHDVAALFEKPELGT